MKKEPITIELRPYDHNVADEVYSHLFYVDEYETEEGYFEIPSASYQLVIGALELIRWEARNTEDKKAINKTIGLVKYFRDKQKMREWKRKEESA